jgi:hypothetical protein
MRYPATEKLEIIRLVEQSHLSARQTLDKLGIPRPTFYRWYDRFQTHGVEGLEDRTSAPSRVWNRIPDDIRDRIITLALDHADLSPRELAVKFTDMGDCQEFCAGGHDDEKERIITWLSKRNYWTSFLLVVIHRRFSARTACWTT